MERPSRAAYAGPSFQKAIASVASATDGAALNNPAKLLGRKTSASRAKVETATPPMKKRMTYSSVTPRPPRAHATNPSTSENLHAGGDRELTVIGSAAQGHSAPPSIQARICSPNACWVRGPDRAQALDASPRRRAHAARVLPPLALWIVPLSGSVGGRETDRTRSDVIARAQTVGVLRS